MATMSEYLMKDLAISVRGKLGPQQHSQVHCSIDDGIGLNDAEISLAINWLKCGDPSFFPNAEKIPAHLFSTCLDPLETTMDVGSFFRSPKGVKKLILCHSQFNSTGDDTQPGMVLYLCCSCRGVVMRSLLGEARRSGVYSFGAPHTPPAPFFFFTFFLFSISTFVRECVCVTGGRGLYAIHSGADGGADR
jgi:hypothetical protein